MTNRERAMNILHYKPVDRMPAVHFGYWTELLTEWAEQGKIPRELAEGNYDNSPKDKELDIYARKCAQVLGVTMEEISISSALDQRRSRLYNCLASSMKRWTTTQPKSISTQPPER